MKKISFVFVILALLAGIYFLYQKQKNSLITPQEPATQNTTTPATDQPSNQGSSPNPPNTPVTNASDPTPANTAPNDSTPIASTESNESSLSEGIKLYYQRDYAKALETLSQEQKTAKAEQDQARTLVYLARTYEYLSKPEDAAKTWQQLAQQFPQNAYAAEAFCFLAKQSEAQNKMQEKFQYLHQAALAAEKNTAGVRAALTLGDEYLPQDKAKAWYYYSLAMHGDLNTSQRQKIKATLDNIVPEFRYQPALTKCMPYSVQSGDTLTSIARKHQTSIGFIQELNHKTNDKLRVKETLKIIPQNLKIEIYKKSFFMVVYLDNGLYYQSYEVCLGKNNCTPIGSFSIKTKEKNPAWFYTDEQGLSIRIPYGDKRHVIGTRWMGFDYQGIGIHGTIDPDSIGKNMSNGCIRMRNEDVERLFDLVAFGTPVTVR